MIAAQEKAVIKTGGNFAPGAHDGKTASSLGDSPIGFHSTYSVDMRNNPYRNKETGENIGERITCNTSKNKLSPKNRTLELYLVRDHGFDLVKTDVEFLSSYPQSPLAGNISRSSHGLKCTLVSDKWFKDDLEFLQTFYSNHDLVMACREKLRVRGFGFNFETKYMPSITEIEDNKESAESDLHGVTPSGLEGSTGEIPQG